MTQPGGPSYEPSLLSLDENGCPELENFRGRNVLGLPASLRTHGESHGEMEVFREMKIINTNTEIISVSLRSSIRLGSRNCDLNISLSLVSMVPGT